MKMNEGEQVQESKDKDEILEAFKHKLHTLVDCEVLDAKTLLEIQKLAEIAHRYVMGLGIQLRRERPMGGPIGYPIGELDFPQVAENYGTKIMREIVPIAQQFVAKFTEPSPADLIKAIALAKENDLPELAERMIEKLKEKVGDKNEMVCSDVERRSSDGDPSGEQKTDDSDVS